MPQLEITGEVFQARVGWKEGGFLAVLNKEENVAAFGDTSSHNPIETHITT